MILAGASADNPSGLWASSNSEGSMPTERLSMRKIRDVLRLKFESGLSERVIGRAMSLSNGSVNSYLQRAAWRAWAGPCRTGSTTRRWSAFVPAGCGPGCGGRS